MFKGGKVPTHAEVMKSDKARLYLDQIRDEFDKVLIKEIYDCYDNVEEVDFIVVDFDWKVTEFKRGGCVIEFNSTPTVQHLKWWEVNNYHDLIVDMHQNIRLNYSKEDFVSLEIAQEKLKEKENVR